MKFKILGLVVPRCLKMGINPIGQSQSLKVAKNFMPEVVIIMLGTNDSKTFNWNTYKNEFIADYNSMIQTFKELNPKSTIYIGLPPPVFENRWEMQKTVVEFEIIKILKNLALENDLKTIDFFTLFQEKSIYFPDGVHPNEEGAKIMADEVSVRFLNK